MASSTSKRSSLSASQRPRLHVKPRADKTYGDLAATFAKDYGLEPDEWQALILDDWLAESGSRWAAITCGLAVPRQNGKNGVIEIRELFGMVGLGEKFLHTAHEVKTAQKHFRRLKHFFGEKANDPGASYPELNRLVKQVRSVNGQEAIFLHHSDCRSLANKGLCDCKDTGGSVEIVARSKNSSRGFTVDVLVFDEAQELDWDEKEALIPTTASAPLGNPQWIYTGTPPSPSAQGAAFSRTREDALDGKRGRVSWIEWSVPEGDVDIHDDSLVYATNPQLDRPRPNGSFGLQREIVEGERNELSPDGFARERLGQWVASASSKSLISADQWGVLEIPASERPPGRLVGGVKFSVDGALAGLSVATSPDDPDVPIHVDEIRLASTAEGFYWLVDWFVKRRESVAQIVIDGKGPDAVLVNMLADAGIRVRKNVKKPTSRLIRLLTLDEYASAHTEFLQAVINGELTHGDGQGLADQVAGATRRKIGTKGGWGWTPLMDAGDVTLLDAVTLAYWGAKTVTRGLSKGVRVG